MPGQEFSRYVEDIPATLAATGWLALIGGGLASVRDIKNPQADVDVALRHWGFSAEQSRRIKAAATPEAFDEAVREEMPRRTPENIAAGRRQAEAAWRQAEQQQADPAQPRLEAITRGERGTEWIVRDSEGRETLRTPNSETAQLALSELQQSAARQRGEGDYAEANTQESPENLNQLRMSKGRQEPHRLAQPINTRYLSHDEQLRDPAHVLQSTLRKSGGAVEGQQGKHGRRLASDSSLFAWADEHRGSYHRNPQDFAKLESGGGEHAIFRDRETGRLVKLTKPGLFGAQAEDAGAYLERLALSNRVFGDDVRFEGIVTLPGEHAPRVVTSQSFVEGRDANAAEQAEYLRGKGFIEHDGRWVHPVLGVAVWDTQTPGNVITRPDGTMQAVDLQVEKARPDELRAVRQQSGLGLPTVFSKAGHKEGGVSREQARQWVDEVLRKWGSQLDVTVHESAEAIPEAAMRDEVLREGDVDAFFNGSDGKIHLLADRVNSVSDAERLLKHEGFHWAVGGKLRVEYGQLVAAIGRKIPSDRMQEIIARYPKGTPELWVEEYLAHLAETNPQSPVWRQFVYEVKRLLRRVFGDRIEYTEEDIRSFLSKAQQRAARAKAADAAEFAEAQQELRFAKNKPKGPQRSSWQEVRIGDRWNSVKKWLPKENVEPTFFPAHGTQEEVVERAYQFIKNNPIVTDWTGRLVYLPYPQSEGSYPNDYVRNNAATIARRVPAILGNGAGGSFLEMQWPRSCRLASDSLEHANTRALPHPVFVPGNLGVPVAGCFTGGTPREAG